MGLCISYVDKKFTDRKSATRSLLSCQGYSKCLFSLLNISIRTGRHTKSQSRKELVITSKCFHSFVLILILQNAWTECR